MLFIFIPVFFYWGLYFTVHYVLTEYADIASEIMSVRIKYFTYQMEQNIVERHDVLSGLVSGFAKIVVVLQPSVSILYNTIFHRAVHIQDLSKIIIYLGVIDLSSQVNPWKKPGRRLNWGKAKYGVLKISLALMAEVGRATAPAFIFEVWDYIFETKFSPTRFHAALNQILEDDSFVLIKQSRNMCVASQKYKKLVWGAHMFGLVVSGLAVFMLTEKRMVDLLFLYHVIYRVFNALPLTEIVST